MLKVLFSKHKKILPKKLQGTFLDELMKYGIMIIISAWIFQGMLYMNWRELTLKIIIDLILVVILSMILPIWLAFLIAHTLNYMFNGQCIAVYNHMGGKGKAMDFLIGIEKMKNRIEAVPYIDSAIAYGSLSRGCYKPTSDIDIRIAPINGELNWWRTCIWAVKERIIAFLNGFPLDMYVFTVEHTTKVMKTDEKPIVIKGDDMKINKYYNAIIQYNDFVDIFKKEQKFNI